jgi:hypothetical protein
MVPYRELLSSFTCVPQRTAQLRESALNCLGYNTQPPRSRGQLYEFCAHLVWYQRGDNSGTESRRCSNLGRCSVPATVALDKSAGGEQRPHCPTMHRVPLSFAQSGDNVPEWQAVGRFSQDSLERTTIRLTKAGAHLPLSLSGSVRLLLGRTVDGGPINSCHPIVPLVMAFHTTPRLKLLEPCSVPLL